MFIFEALYTSILFLIFFRTYFGKFWISIALRFYVKSILGHFEHPTTAILTIFAALNLNFCEVLTFKSVKLFKKSDFENVKSIN